MYKIKAKPLNILKIMIFSLVFFNSSIVFCSQTDQDITRSSFIKRYLTSVVDRMDKDQLVKGLKHLGFAFSTALAGSCLQCFNSKRIHNSGAFFGCLATATFIQGLIELIESYTKKRTFGSRTMILTARIMQYINGFGILALLIASPSNLEGTTYFTMPGLIKKQMDLAGDIAVLSAVGVALYNGLESESLPITNDPNC